MNTFNIQPGKQVGDLKALIREAILEGEINNDYQEAFNFMIDKARQMGINPVG